MTEIPASEYTLNFIVVIESLIFCIYLNFKVRDLLELGSTTAIKSYTVAGVGYP
jgi:hypothetical protein